jgi:hypothetical protein
MAGRYIKSLVDSAAPAAGTTVLVLGVPEDAEAAILHVKATTAGLSTVDAKIVQYPPDGTATAAVDAGVAIDQIPASQTAVGRYVAWGGELTAVAGTNFDQVAVSLSGTQRLSYTLAGTVTNLKIWIEFIKG